MASSNQEIREGRNTTLMNIVAHNMRGYARYVQQLPTIHKVVSHIRNEAGDGSYDPKIVSIGPYHHDREFLDSPKGLKWAYLNDLLHRTNKPEHQYRLYLEEIGKLQKYAREHYSEEIDLHPEAFAHMLVLDGCFIIELFIKHELGEITSPLAGTQWTLPLLIRDLLLLENQIPYFILAKLFECSKSVHLLFSVSQSSDPSQKLKELATKFIGFGDKRFKPLKIIHLLHLLHSSLQEDLIPNLRGGDEWSFRDQRFNTPMTSMRRRSPPQGLYPLVKPLRDMPSARKLFESGGDLCLLNVTFNAGILKIPYLYIHDDTISWFRNLVAFEQCCCRTIISDYFTNFAIFMDNLIDTADDVALLEEHHIIGSRLGSAQDVAQFFNSLSKGVYVVESKEGYFANLCKEVTKYCGLKKHKWKAILVHKHLNNPWTVTSLIAGLLLLLMTLLQTIFSVLSYSVPKKF